MGKNLKNKKIGGANLIFPKWDQHVWGVYNTEWLGQMSGWYMSCLDTYIMMRRA